MKKNLLTIIILALGILNMILTAVLVFAVVPTTIRTNNLISKVASAIDLELESDSEDGESQVSIEDIEVYDIKDPIIINLKPEANDTTKHYAQVYVSLSLNTKSKDYKTLQPTVEANESAITEIVNDEFAKYTVNNVLDNKEKIKEEILKKVQELFQSDFIISISIGKIVVE
ncbi:MAG: Flagellar protein FliL [Lachnoclostridium sp.]